MRLQVVTLLLLLTPCLVGAEELAGRMAEENEALRNGLTFVETKGLAWLRERKCASCHHVAQMVWAQRDARARGLAIDEKGLAEATEFLLAADNRARIVPNPDDPPRAGNPYSLLAAYTVLAFREGGKEAEPAAGAGLPGQYWDCRDGCRKFREEMWPQVRPSHFCFGLDRIAFWLAFGGKRIAVAQERRE